MLTLLESHLIPTVRSVHISSSGGARSVLSSEDGLSGFIKFQLSDFTVGCVNWHLNLRAVLLVLDDLLNMDAPSSSVDCHNLSDLTLDSVLHGAGFDVDGITLSNWNRFAGVLSLEFFAQVAAHHLSSQAAWSSEVGLSRLSSLTGNT